MIEYPTTEDKFWRFHRKNPKVYLELVVLAREAKRRGRRRWGIRALFEILRWQREVDGLPDSFEKFKMNNNYAALYAKLIMEREPDLANYFFTRKCK